jgi:hypothetical protein
LPGSFIKTNVPNASLIPYSLDPAFSEEITSSLFLNASAPWSYIFLLGLNKKPFALEIRESLNECSLSLCKLRDQPLFLLAAAGDCAESSDSGFFEIPRGTFIS